MLDLEQLTEFNTALVYGFEPEGSPLRQIGIETFEAALFPTAGQYEDMLNAYLFAQTEILPFLRANNDITVQQFLDGIDKIHGYMAKTLLEMHGEVAGRYTEESVSRWHKGARINDHMVLYISGIHPCKTNKQLAALLVDEFGVDKTEVLAFIRLLKKIAEDSTIAIHHSQQGVVEHTTKIAKRTLPGVLALSKLQVAYHDERLLTATERKIVENIVKICMFPTEIPAAMNRFASTTIDRFKACDREDLEQVSSFLADLFYEFTENHPYANGNGRVGTCLVNIFLRCWGLPSILLRHPGEKSDAASLYSRAIAQIDVSRALLKELIKQRIIAAKTLPFNDENLCKTVCLRVEWSDVIKRIKSKHPNFNLDEFQERVTTAATQKMGLDDPVKLLQELIILSSRQEKTLDSMRKAVPFSLSSPLSPEQKAQLISALDKLTGTPDWKIAQRDGIVPWTQSTDKGTAVAIAEKLNVADIGKITLSQRTDNKAIWVVKCDEIKLQKLLRDTVASKTTEHREGMAATADISPQSL